MKTSPTTRYIELMRDCVSYWHWLSDEEKVKRSSGRDWPKASQGESMIGRKRLDNIHQCLATILSENVPGDLIETGVWRGGAVIFMKAILEAYGSQDRRVWVADSFRGVPPPNPTLFPADKDDRLYQYSELSVPKDEVVRNFEKYGLLDDRVIFLEGWFKDTLASAPIDTLALLRIDGDLYESTIQALEALYPKLVSGGFCIIDDYGTFEYCEQAVAHYRQTHEINEQIEDIDGWGIFWRKR